MENHRVPLRLAALDNMAGRLFIQPGESFRADPGEMPLKLTAGDDATVNIVFAPPGRPAFGGHVPVTVRLDDKKLSTFSVTYCPWRPAGILPKPGPCRIRRISKRAGIVIDDTKLVLSRAFKAGATLRLDCYSNGEPDTKLILTVHPPPPWRPYSFDRVLPGRRAWHKITFTFNKNAIRKETVMCLTRMSRSPLLLGKAMILD